MSVDFGKFSDFNKDASFDMIRFGAGVPIPECELNEMQQIQLQHIKSINKHLYGDNHFIGYGDMTFNADTHEFALKNQYVMLDDGTMIYVDKLEGICNDGNTVFLDFELKDIRYVDVIHKYGNKQSSDIIENNILDPRVGKQTTMRKQWCYDLFIAKQSIEVDNHIYIPVAKNNGGRLVDLRDCVEIINRNIDDAQYSKVSTGSPITDIECRQDGFVSGEKIYGKTLQNLFNPNGVKAVYGPNRNIIYEDIDIRKEGIHSLINLSSKPIRINFVDTSKSGPAWIMSNDAKIQPNSILVIDVLSNYGKMVSNGLLEDGWEDTDTDASRAELEKSLMVLEGDWTDKEIPTEYFSGLKSVENPIKIKAVGKNLFNMNDIVYCQQATKYNIYDEKSLVLKSDGYTYPINASGGTYVEYKLPVNTNTTYTLSFIYEQLQGNSDLCRVKICPDYSDKADTQNAFFDGKPEYMNNINFNTGSCKCIRVLFYPYLVNNINGDSEIAVPYTEIKFSNIQLEEGTEVTEYEPCKETIQTIYTEPLRSIGDIKDEIDIDRGVITRRIATSNENYAKGRIWGSGTTDTHLTICTHYRYNVNSPTRKEMQDMKLVCDIFPVIGTGITTDALRALMPNISSPQIFIDKDGDIDIVASKTFFTDNGYTADENGFKKYLSEHPYKWMATLPTSRPIEEKINIPPLRVFEGAKHLLLNGVSTPQVEFDYPQNIKAQVDENTDELQRVGKNLIIPSNPNLLINGDFQVWQRGTSFNGNTSRPTYTVDRWIIAGDTAPKVEKVENGVKITSTQNGTWTNFYTKLENITLRKLIGKTLTYTIKLKVPTRISQVWSVTVGTGSGEYQYHHSKGFNDKNYEYLTGSFVVKSTQFDDNGFFEFGIQGISEANNSFEIEYAKLEVGDKVTPFVPRPYGEEFALCQRYYIPFVTGFETGHFTDRISYSCILPCQMRIKPSIESATVYGNSTVVDSSGFTYRVDFFNNNLISISALKNNHGINSNLITHIDIKGIDSEIY